MKENTMDIKMEKDGGVKLVNNESTKKLLLDVGWKVEEETDEALDLLRAEAVELGLDHHPKLGAKKLTTLINEHKEALLNTDSE